MLRLHNIALALPAFALVLAEQVPLDSKRQPARVTAEIEALFAADQQLNAFTVPGWGTDAWNGLVTFGHAPPVRCWGADKDVPFDIAVIGTNCCFLMQ
jgi:hypothetical protein